MPARICLITPGHLSSAPRVVKEASALCGAGYDVVVVSGRHHGPNEPLDDAILAKARWDNIRVHWGGLAARASFRIRRTLARTLIARAGECSVWQAADAIHPGWRRLAAAASGVDASLVIGHCPAGLAAAASATLSSGAHLGFDVEDFHDAETDATVGDPIEQAALRTLQSQCAPRCVHLTAASPGIADAFGHRYACRPVPLLNTFPLHERPAHFVPGRLPGPATPLRAYWFSQTIGPGRGLEGAVRTLSLLPFPSEIHLRGFGDAGYLHNLERLAAEGSNPCRIVLHPPAAAEQMACLAAHADLGLSLEQPLPLNRDLCLTNKIFTYLLAGIPQWLSPTTAQRQLAPDLGAAALVADPSDPPAAARTLATFFSDFSRIESARETARKLATTRYCWEIEQTQLVASVAGLLPLPNP